MDNLGDWLYIVFLVIAVISGLFSGKKKKHPVAKPVQPREQTEDPLDTEKEKTFWEILEEMQKSTQEAKPRTKKVPATKQVSTKTVKASAAPSPFLAGESIGSSRIPKQNSILLEETYEADHRINSEDFHLQDVDEVRKAIIYSEILNRKY